MWAPRFRSVTERRGKLSLRGLLRHRHTTSSGSSWLAHLGEPYYIDRNRNVIENPSDDFVSGDRLRARADYLLQYAWKSGNVAVRDLADHAPINYVTAIAAQP